MTHKTQLTKKSKEIKDYSEVLVGDVAYENPDAGGNWDNKLGKIVWKGSYSELLESDYQSLATDLEDGDVEEYDWVVVEDSVYGPTLFNYNGDPCGVVVFQTK
jgi:hypothetical protein